MSFSGVSLAFLVGAIPTLTMSLASILLTSISVSSLTEAAFQNFAAGLILAAVASELFPLMIGADISASNSMIGISAGFAIGLLMLNGTEAAIEFFIQVADKRKASIIGTGGPSTVSDIVRKKTDIPFDNIEENLSLELSSFYAGRRGSHGDRVGFLENETWEEAPLAKASLAIASPRHRNHLEAHLVELHDCILLMEAKATQLFEGHTIPLKDSEQIAEEIDEAIHSLQYKLDHCKRLLQGSETDAELSIQGTTIVNTVLFDNGWSTDAKRIQLKGRLNGLKATATHLVEHIKEAVIDKDTLQEMHEHMEHMDTQLSSFHSSVEKGTNIYFMYVCNYMYGYVHIS